ncbi:MAG: DNA replication/repair protein RecF [Methylophaga sp.]|nr:MAG: DNA replication/repair protein RecF [Methylophaga sp.]
MLTQLTVSNLRNITKLTLEPISGINLILGANGSGKTSLLEAIHLLAMGRSFRTRSLKNAIQFEQQQFQITAKTSAEVPVGLQYNSDGLKIRLNRAPLKRLSELAMQLPLQFVPANCHQFFEQGPRYRRQLLDWGLFHVEPSFNSHWQAYKKILQQRNSALRQHKPTSEIQLWDAHLASHGEVITALRRQQLEKILQQFSVLFARLCPEFSGAGFTLKYRNGWLKDLTLEQALSGTIDRDKQLGYTRSGSHAADWSFKINDADPVEMFSRGQQKLFFLALCMVQAKMADDINQDRSILLFDDISSELDQQHQQNVMKELIQLPIQTFVTATDFALEESEKTKVFHVERGELR